MAPKNKTIAYPTTFVAAFQELHRLFTGLIALRPWELIHESIILGVKHPQSGELWYAYFMGELGEVVGFNLYDSRHIGNWMYIMKEMEEDVENFSSSDILSHTFMQILAGKKSRMAPEIIALHEQAGIAVPRGKAGFTEPLSYKAGYAPAMQLEGDLRTAALLIPGFMHLLKSIEAGMHTDIEALADKGKGIVAIQNAQNSWQTESRELPDPEATDIYAAEAADAKVWDAVRNLPKVSDEYIFHAEILPAPFTDADGVGVFSILLICLAGSNGMILNFVNVPAPEWKYQASGALADILKKIGRLPRVFVIGDNHMKPLITAGGAALSIPVIVDREAGSMAEESFSFIASAM